MFIFKLYYSYLNTDIRIARLTIMKKSKKELIKSAFTLAEVLITLGVIGVVAAITIPSLYANVVGHKYRSLFKKTVSSIDQAARLNKANYDWDFADVNEPCNNEDYINHTADNQMSACAIFNSNLTGITHYYRESTLTNKYGYKVNGSTVGVSLGGGQYTIYQLSSGAFIAFRSFSFSSGCTLNIGSKLDYEKMRACTGFIDINGLSLPNEEVKCSVGTTSKNIDSDCIVKNKDMKDMFPIIYHDSVVEPATNAARYVLQTTK